MELRVMMDGEEVGHLRKESGSYYFAYSNQWLENGFSISPRSLPLEDRLFKSRNDRFDGLFGVFADSLPDGWGTFTAIKALREKGISYLSLDPLERLSLVDDRGLGALYYEPSDSFQSSLSDTDLDDLCDRCNRMIENMDTDADDIFRRAGSTGGARPKVNTTIGGEEWIVKFRERNDPKWIGRMEYQCNIAARECGIDVPDIGLLQSKMCDGYFSSKRFDRRGKERIHMISLGGLLEVPHDMPLLDYHTFLQAVRFITRSQAETVKAYRLSCFNILIGNRDDHSKNYAFLYDRDAGAYRLSPAYDLTVTPDLKEHEMSCMGNGQPGERELLQLADVMNISKKDATEIIGKIKDVIENELSEWLRSE